MGVYVKKKKYDKDFLRQKKLELNKLTVDNLQPKEKVAIRSRRQLIYPAQPDQSSKRNHLEQENEDLKLKIRELEEQLKDSTNSTMEDCKTKISTLEEELDQMALQLADRECEAIELREKLESLEKRKQSDDTMNQLASRFQENMEKLQAIVDQHQTNFSSTPSRMSASARSDNLKNDCILLVPFHGNISITRASMRRILIAARLGKTEKDLNNTVTTILDAFYSPAELAEYSRTGKVCLTKPGTLPKKKFPEDILNAISGFITSRWSTWHEGAVVEEATVHAAVGHGLLGCHTNTRKRKLRHPDLNVDNILNEELTRANDSLGM
ncbi:Uncharacterized protein APZ42_025355 [Daphnia magna]|uniref:BEN domain-containing protein n=1 Tax=Daphnia magna TaxID=35525 RepID=A0A164T7M3_9CRUS|nr:Uncharacterized protein APZ42_025355 [Daphnia magna]